MEQATNLTPVYKASSIKRKFLEETPASRKLIRHSQSKLEHVPREIRDIIYKHLGLATTTIEANFGGVKVRCRHVFVSGNQSLRVQPAEHDEAGDSSPPTLELSAALALAGTRRIFRAEINDLLFGNAVLVFDIDEMYAYPAKRPSYRIVEADDK